MFCQGPLVFGREMCQRASLLCGECLQHPHPRAGGGELWKEPERWATSNGSPGIEAAKKLNDGRSRLVEKNRMMTL